MATQVIMPQLGESVVEGTVMKWLKKEGESIQEFESLLEVNTDKVDSEIPSPTSGVILKILVPEGTTVRAGTVIAWIGEPGEQPGGEGGMVALPAVARRPSRAHCQTVAEREGFEPSVEFPLRRFSKPVPSASRPPLRVGMFRPTTSRGGPSGGKT